MERQGCCPLCKTTVLPDSIVDEEGEGEQVPAVEPSPTTTTDEIDVGAVTMTTPPTERSNQ